LDEQLTKFQNELEKFNMYLPKNAVRPYYLDQNSWDLEIINIQRDMKLKVDEYIKKIDHSFGLDNYDYVQQNVRD